MSAIRMTRSLARKSSGIHPVEYFVLFLVVVAAVFALAR
jgi:hypothetical protein